MAGRYQSAQVLLLREAGQLLDPAPAQARLLFLVPSDSPLRASVARLLRLHRVTFDEASLKETIASEVTAEEIQDPRAMVLIAPPVPDELRTELEARLASAGKSACRFRNSIGEVRLVVWLAPAEKDRCAEAAYRW
jgi:hypothetical protein